MHQQLVAETTLEGLRPLGIGGQRILDSWGKIDAYLRANLGDAHADLFAEPQPTGSGLTWFSGPEGSVVPFGALDEADQQTLAAELEARITAIRGKIAELKASRQESDQTLAETLDRALVLPQRRDGRDFLYSVGGEPVLINWGTRDEASQPSDAVLQDFLHEAQQRPRSSPRLPDPARDEVVSSEPSGPAADAVPAAASGFWVWPLWLLFTLLVAATLYALLAGCGLGLPGSLRPAWLNYCPGVAAATETDPPPQESDRAEALRLELRELERRLAQIPQCPQTPVVDSGASEEAEASAEDRADQVPDDDESDRRVQEAGGDPSDYQITLWWDGDADLDLHLECPDGSRVFWNAMASSACGAELNIDANRDAGTIMRSPVEHIIWPRSVPPSGHYRILVDNYAGRSVGRTAPVPFQVRIKLGGVEERRSGSVSQAQIPVVLYEFDVP